jgi:hypothetical protein
MNVEAGGGRPPPAWLGNLRRMVEMMMNVMGQDEVTNGYE